MATRTVVCPHCSSKNSVDFDIYGIEGTGLYHQSEDCSKCGGPFAAFIRARFEVGAVKIVIPEETP